MNLFRFLTILQIAVICMSPCAYADSRPSNSMMHDFSSCDGGITKCFSSKDSMAYRNMMADGPAQMVDEYYEQGCKVKILRFWSPEKESYVVRTIRNCE
jgi:hypothetical protein